MALLPVAVAAAGQELPFEEHLRIDPRQVVTAESCGECHVAEHEVWKRTPHATGFRTLHRKEQALAIAGKLGFRLIKRGSVCFSCHYTPVVDDGALRVASGVSCESCHGAGRGWIDLHNDYGEGFDHRSEPVEHRSRRIEASRAAGMRRPSDLYPVVANCFSCHTVPLEELVDVGGHTTGSDGFEFVEWSQGEIRHNFLASTLARAAPENANRPMSRKRVMYVVGRALDLEYSLRGVAVAKSDGIYAKAMIRRVRSALSELQAVDAAATVPEVGQMLGIVRAVQVRPRNREALVAAADRIGAATRRFLDAAEPERLAGLDDLVLGREPEPIGDAEVVAAAGGGPGSSGGVGTGGGAGAAGGTPGAAAGGTPTAAAGDPGAAGGARGVAAEGTRKRRLRPAAAHRTLGPGACTGCHTPQNEWWFADRHNRAADPFFEGDPDRIRVATLYGLSPAEMTLGRNLCMDCHGTVISGKESRPVLDGVSCESCHGPAADWLEPHKDETDKQLGRRRPGHLAALERGKTDLRDQAVRARTCASCHYVTDPRLLSAGHPSGTGFDYAAAVGKIRHWQWGPAPAAQLAAAFRAVVAERGPVPSVRRAVLADAGAAAGGGGRSGGSGLGRGRSSGAAADPRTQPEILFLEPPPVRPSRAGAAGDSVALELPPFPEVAESAPVEELLEIVRRRLELLYRAVAGGEGR